MRDGEGLHRIGVDVAATVKRCEPEPRPATASPPEPLPRQDERHGVYRALQSMDGRSPTLLALRSLWWHDFFVRVWHGVERLDRPKSGTCRKMVAANTGVSRTLMMNLDHPMVQYEEFRDARSQDQNSAR